MLQMNGKYLVAMNFTSLYLRRIWIRMKKKMIPALLNPFSGNLLAFVLIYICIPQQVE